MKKLAKVFLINENNELLMGLRPKHIEYSPGKWSLFGGHVEEGETFEEAAIREVLEETGIKLDSLEKVHEEKIVRHRVWFVAQINTPKEEIILTEEEDCGFFTCEEALKLDTSPNTTRAINFYMELNK